jgi:rubredoxin
MTETLEAYCPSCDAGRPFDRAASTELYLGTKTKWDCPACDYGFVRIGSDVDTSTA